MQVVLNDIIFVANSASILCNSKAVVDALAIVPWWHFDLKPKSLSPSKTNGTAVG